PSQLLETYKIVSIPNQYNRPAMQEQGTHVEMFPTLVAYAHAPVVQSEENRCQLANMLGTCLLKGVPNEETNVGNFTSLAYAVDANESLILQVLDFIPANIFCSLEEVKESAAKLPQGLFDFGKTSKDAQRIIDNLMPYPRLVCGILEDLGIKTGQNNDMQLSAEELKQFKD
ncbi:hypothetical protein PspLS_10286, partial [Pyricularia sp. CBS 133598]